MNFLDGGYYAIKGFSFQYDKTIIHILEKENDTDFVEIELSEDLSDANSIIQVKYKEKSTYTNSAIKKPVCQLLETYKVDKRESILYAFFKDKDEEEKTLSLKELNEIIGNCKIGNKQYYFNEDLKREFIKNFKIIFTKKYYDQIMLLIEKTKEIFNCSEEEALVYYPLMYKYVEQKITDNPPEEKQERICTKGELKDYVLNSKKIIFETSYIDFLGKEKYCELIKKKYFTSCNRNDWERFFLIDISYNINITLIKNICLKLREKFYLKSNIGDITYIKSPAPYIFLINIDKNIYKDLKQELLWEEYVFRDGFCFEHADFYLNNLIEKCTSQNNIEIRFINEMDHFIQAIQKINKTKKIYYFYKEKHENLHISSEVYFIEIDELEDLLQII